MILMTQRVAPLCFLALAVACDDGTTNGPGPGGDGGAGPVSASVLISEIMYHPVQENAPEDNHEFVEIYNREDGAVDLTGWRLTGEIKFTFPAGATIPAHGYRVIAKNRAALAAVATYQLSAADLLGDYPANLSNSGGTLN